MGTVCVDIDERNAAFINAQHVFFVATAPAGAEGHINLSPQGLDSLRILGPRSVACVDLAGRGVETLAHRYQGPPDPIVAPRRRGRPPRPQPVTGSLPARRGRRLESRPIQVAA